MPLSYFAFGSEGLDYAVIIFALMTVYAFTFGIWVVAGRNTITLILKEPVFGATIIGGLFLWQGWETPKFITSTLELIGQMAIPLMLITLGVAIAKLKANNLLKATGYYVSKLLICSLSAWFVAHYFELTPIATSILILQVTTPVAVFSYFLVNKYNADTEAVAGLVIVSTVFLVVYLPFFLILLL